MKLIEKVTRFFKKDDSVHFDLYDGDIDKYMARHIITNCLKKPLDGATGISPDSKKHVHLICTDCDSLMLNIARQVALLCHFPNFDDEKTANRTKITILAPNISKDSDLDGLMLLMSSESLFGNLLEECVWQAKISGTSVIHGNHKTDSFLDVEFEIIGLSDGRVDAFLSNFTPAENEITSIITYPNQITASLLERLQDSCHQIHIIDKNDSDFCSYVDIRMARRANIVYLRGRSDRNIFNNNLEDAEAYSRLLKTLIKNISCREEKDCWNSDSMPNVNRASNVYCTDCYPYYQRSIASICKRTFAQQDLVNNIDVMSRVEHARWNVEKLIMGFRTLTPEEILIDESLTGKDKIKYRKELKASKVHIDLCSINRLRCIDPDALKYDSFLVLAMPFIVKSLKK